MKDNLAVGLGEIKLSQDPEDILVAYGLGSCVAVGMADPQARVAGLLHAVLPYNPNGSLTPSPKYVNNGIEILLNEIIAHGAHPNRLIIRVAGGANMLNAPGYTQSFNIGSRNVEATYETLQRLKLKVTSQEVGGTIGRTVRFYVRDGKMTIRTLGNQEREI
ncbi:MAG: chemotaxis protein CheD [Anaerolineales bacterium]